MGNKVIIKKITGASKEFIEALHQYSIDKEKRAKDELRQAIADGILYKLNAMKKTSANTPL